jgi:hypothetical protein
LRALFVSGGNFDAHARIFNADGTAASDEFLVHAVTQEDQFAYSAGALADGGFVAAWRDGNNAYSVFVQRYDADGNMVGDKFQVNSLGATRTRTTPRSRA